MTALVLGVALAILTYAVGKWVETIAEPLRRIADVLGRHLEAQETGRARTPAGRKRRERSRARAERRIKEITEAASDAYGFFPEAKYLYDEADKRWDREYRLWRFDHPAAALALDETEREFKAELAERTDLTEEERFAARERDWPLRLAAWAAEYPEADRAYTRMHRRAYLEADRFEAIAMMPEVVEARERGSKQRMEKHGSTEASVE